MMLKMKFHLAVLALLLASVASAQDVLNRKDGTNVPCKVVEIGTEEVTYTEWGDPSGIVYAVAVGDLQAITFQNGEQEVFAKADEKDKHEARMANLFYMAPTEDLGGGQLGVMSYGLVNQGIGWQYGFLFDYFKSDHKAYYMFLGANYSYFLTDNIYLFLPVNVHGGFYTYTVEMPGSGNRTKKETKDEFKIGFDVTPSVAFRFGSVAVSPGFCLTWTNKAKKLGTAIMLQVGLAF